MKRSLHRNARNRPWCALLTSAFLSAVVSFNATAEVVPQATQVDVLDNGLTTVIVPLPGTGVAALQTWVGTGSRNETEPGTTGYAHFFEHLMFHGTPSLDGPAREKRLMELAVVENAWTSQDETCYHQLMPASALEAVIPLEADRFQNLLLKQGGVELEAGAVAGEFRLGRADPSTHVYESLWGTAFTSHTYGHSVLGTEEDVGNMPQGLTAAMRFYHQHYRPENLVVVVTGDVDPTRTQAALVQAWSDWQPPAMLPNTEATTEPPQDQTRRTEILWDQGPTTSQLAIGWKMPSYQLGNPDSAALDVVTELLGSDVALLRKRLVDDENLAWSIHVSGGQYRSPGLFEIHIELRPEADPNTVEKVVDEEIKRIQSADLAKQVSAAIARLSRIERLRRESAEDWAFSVGWATSLMGDPKGIDQHLAALEAVTASQVQRVSEQWLVESGKTVVLLKEETQ